MHCPRMDSLPVISDWQIKIYCPNCKHYSTGQCNNPTRKNDTDPCPLTNVEPIEFVGEFTFKVHQKVLIKPQNVEGEIVNRQLSSIGVLYEVKTADNRFWITENHLE